LNIRCKTELNSKINDLEEELERKNAKLKAFQSENEELKTKRMNPNTQLKQTVEDLKEESQQKDLLISTLKKSIKDDRAMRAVSAVRRPKEDDIKRDKKVDNQLFQEIADLRAMTETQKNTIKHLEVVKWDYEKNLKELKEQMKQKAKEKEMEISELKDKIDKIKVRMNRNENEKQLLQNKVTLREKTQKNRQHKWTQTTGAVSEQDVNKLKQEMKTV
jgi:chromosome segregation ATPase